MKIDSRELKALVSSVGCVLMAKGLILARLPISPWAGRTMQDGVWVIDKYSLPNHADRRLARKDWLRPALLIE
jgi:hypothetical protein